VAAHRFEAQGCDDVEAFGLLQSGCGLAEQGVGKLHAPETTEYAFYDEYERIDGRVKQLLDNKRVYGLKKYYLAKEYHDWANGELAKVDWARQPRSVDVQYHVPLFFVRIKERAFLFLYKILKGTRKK
jgi:hypothetical protein